MSEERALHLPAAAPFSARVVAAVQQGARFSGMFGSAEASGTRIVAVLATGTGLRTEETVVPETQPSLDSLTPQLPAATWYEREIHDLFGVEFDGHRQLEPLVLPVAAGSPRPRPGSGKLLDPVELDLQPLPRHVRGEGVFTIPYGPVRSGVFESIEYLVETPGEDIPYLRTRVFHKHRGVEVRFEGMSPADGVLLAERYEGVASVAHAIAYSTAVERVAGIEISDAPGLVRVVHAELERVANHLDSFVRHAEAAGQAVAYARLTLHKERVQRLRGRLCGSRFGRGVVVPGGVRGGLGVPTPELFEAIDEIEHGARADLRLLMATPSFIDRLRGTGFLPPELAQRRALLGPLGRGSGQMDDGRVSRPYASYALLGHRLMQPFFEGDALARQRVRIDEIGGAFHLIRQAIDLLDERRHRDGPWLVPLEPGLTGEAFGWAEAPQGEVLYFLALDEDRLTRVKPRSASFHNLAVFPTAFPRDILTDFAFIEASFGLSIAGVAG